MTVKAYITVMGTLFMSIWFTPDLGEMLKVYVISVSAIVSLLVALAFHIARIREYVINHLVAAVLQEILKDPDIRKLINWKDRQALIRERLKEELRKRNENKD